jgi:hypothetical protein
VQLFRQLLESVVLRGPANHGDDHER